MPILRCPASRFLMSFEDSSRVRNTSRGRPDFFAASSSSADVVMAALPSGVSHAAQPSNKPSVTPVPHKKALSLSGPPALRHTPNPTPAFTPPPLHLPPP